MKVSHSTVSGVEWNPFLSAQDKSLDFKRKTKTKHLEISVYTLQEGQDLKHPED